MPFKSKAQMKYMYANHPEIAKRWREKYKQDTSKLPEHKKKKEK